jgi:biotin-(acetyl-CoA carboxylase) ligase
VQALDTFFAKGFAAFAPAYRERSVLLGKRVRFQQADAPVAGRVVDHAADGSLLVLLDGQEAPSSFISGEVTGLQLDTGELVEGTPT